MAVRRGCSGTDIPVVYLHSLSKQVHSVHVSIVTSFRPGAQNCNLYDYYMINILNVNVVRSNAAFLKWTCFCLPHCHTNSLYYKFTVFIMLSIFVFKFIEKTVFHELQLLFRPSWMYVLALFHEIVAPFCHSVSHIGYKFHLFQTQQK